MAKRGPGRGVAPLSEEINAFKTKAIELIDSGMRITKELAGELAQFDNDENVTCIDSLKSCMLNFCEMERDTKLFLDRAEEIKNMIGAAGPDDQLPDLAATLQSRYDDAKKSVMNQDLHIHPAFRDLDKQLEDISVQVMEKDMAVEEDEEETAVQLDEDLAMTQSIVITKCPITCKEMVNPMRNKRCNHNYERDGIMEHLNNLKGRGAKCPVSGCVSGNYHITHSDLEENVELKKLIERKNRLAAGKIPKR